MKHVLLPILRRALDDIGAPADVPIVIEYPRRGAAHVSTPVAMAIARTIETSPQNLAGHIAGRLSVHPAIALAEAAAGHVNVTFTTATLLGILKELLRSCMPETAPMEMRPDADDRAVAEGFAADALANIGGVLRHNASEGFAANPATSLEPLVSADDRALVLAVLRAAETVEESNRESAQAIAIQLDELAGACDTFLSRCRVLPEAPPVRDARLALLVAAQCVFAKLFEAMREASARKRR